MKQKIIRQFSLRLGLVILLANFSAGWMIARPALSAEFDMGVVADTNTAIPGGSGNFTDFGSPSLDGGDVVFSGHGRGGQKGIYVAFQEHRWGTGASGSWDDKTNWSFSTLPRDVVPTFINPEHSVNVVGPLGLTTIRSLTLGSQTTGVTTLDLTGGGTLTVDQSTVITARGKLTGDGIINALGGSVMLAKSIWARPASRSPVAY